MKDVKLKICFTCRTTALSLELKPSGKCTRCSTGKDRDKFTAQNNMASVWKDGDKICYDIPLQLSCLSLAERMILQRVSVFIPQKYINHGTFCIKGHVCCFPQDIGEVFDELPRLPQHVKMVKFIRKVTARWTSSGQDLLHQQSQGNEGFALVEEAQCPLP